MKEIDYKIYTELKKGSISMGQIPKTVRNSQTYKNLLGAKILQTEKSGRGSKLIVKDQSSFNSFYSNFFSEEEVTSISKYSNIKKLRDSKSRKTVSANIFFIRGFKEIVINGEKVDLNKQTKQFGFFGVKLNTLEFPKICFVENLNSFENAEKLFGDEYIYLHKYGRIGFDAIKNIVAKDVMVFVDYDFNGLDEYLRIKNVFGNALLHYPNDFEELFKDYSKRIKGKQKQTKRVESSQLPEVIKIREMVSRSNRFLEQEILIND
jgi:hypothetical protein